MGCFYSANNQDTRETTQVKRNSEIQQLKAKLNYNNQCRLQHLDELKPERLQKFLDDNNKLLTNLQIMTQISQAKNNETAQTILLKFDYQIGLLINEQKFTYDNIENVFEQFQIQLILFYNMAFLEQQLRLNNSYEFRYIQQVNWNSEMINKFNNIIENYNQFFQDLNQQGQLLQNVQLIIQNLDNQISQCLTDNNMEIFFSILNDFQLKLQEAKQNLQNRTNLNDQQQMPMEFPSPMNTQQLQQNYIIQVPLHFCEKQNSISKKCKHTCENFAFLKDNGDIICRNKGCQIFNLHQCCFIYMEGYYLVVDENQSNNYNGKNILKMCNKMIVDMSLNRGFENLQIGFNITEQEKQNFINSIRQLQFYRDLPN